MIIRRILFLLTLSTIGIGMSAEGEKLPLKTGDLVFTLGSGTDFSKAITSATAAPDEWGYDHVAIVEVDDNGSVFIVEAHPQEGVRITTWENFIDLSPKIDGKPGVVVKRVITPFSPTAAVAMAKSHLGEPYDWWYLPDNGKMYCSELIYVSYNDRYGKPIFKTLPMNFRAADGSVPDFWIELFRKIGRPIPQGLQGTNPTDMAKDENLIEVIRLF